MIKAVTKTILTTFINTIISFYCFFDLDHPVAINFINVSSVSSYSFLSIITEISDNPWIKDEAKPFIQLWKELTAMAGLLSIFEVDHFGSLSTHPLNFS